MAIEATVTPSGKPAVNNGPNNRDLGFDLTSPDKGNYPKTEDITFESDFLKEASKTVEREAKKQVPRKPVVGEEEVNEQEEVPSEEPTLELEGEEGDEEPEAKPKAKVASRKLVEIEEPKPLDHSVEQVREHNRFIALHSYLKQLGCGVKDDGSDIGEHFNGIAKQNALYAQQLLENASKYAEEQAAKYFHATVVPHENKKTAYRVQQTIKFLQQEFPDIMDYVEEMDNMSGALLKKYPHLHGQVEQALPILYQKAKEKNLVAASKTVNRDKKAALEKSSARQGSKGTRRSQTPEAEVDRVFGPAKGHALDGLWG